MVCPCTKGRNAEHLHMVQAHFVIRHSKRRMRTDAVKRALTAGMAQLNAACCIALCLKLQHGGKCAWVTFSLRESADYRKPR